MSKSIWVFEYRNDRYCDREITLCSSYDKARSILKEWIDDKKDERYFERDGRNSASWRESNGDYVGVTIWKQKVI